MTPSSKCTGGRPRIDVTQLSEEDREKIAAMSEPNEMEASERKRQYAALRRAVAKSCSAPLLAKFQLCNDGERPAYDFVNVSYSANESE